MPAQPSRTLTHFGILLLTLFSIGCYATPKTSELPSDEAISAKTAAPAETPALTPRQAALPPLQVGGRGANMVPRIRRTAGWDVEGSAFFWYPTIDGDLTMKKGKGSFAISESDAFDIFDRFEGFVPFMIVAKKELMLVEIDVIYGNFNDNDLTDVTNSPTAVNADTAAEMWLTNLKLGYQFGGAEGGNTSGTSLWVTGGVRYAHIEANIDIVDPGGPIHVRNDEDFIALDIGARFEIILSDTWTGLATASFGGSEDVRGTNVELLGAVVYESGDEAWTFGAGYQYVDIDFEEGDLPDAALKFRAKGPVVFATFHF